MLVFLVFLVVVALVLVLNASLIVKVFRELRAAAPGIRRTLGWVAWTALTLLFVWSLIGCLLSGVVTTLRAASDQSVDPSQKARMLAEGISLIINCGILSLVSLLPLVGGLWIQSVVAGRRAAE